MLKLAFRNIFRNRQRSGLTLAAIICGVAAIIVSGGFVEDTFVQMRESTIRSQLGHMQIFRQGYLEYGRREPSRYLIEHPQKITEAIQEFQKAQANPHRRIAAMNMLAQCFGKRRMYDLAAHQLQTALKEKTVFDDEKKELIYNLGCVLENMGKKDEAVEQFKLIYEVEIGYKDVAAKVDKYYNSGQ